MKDKVAVSVTAELASSHSTEQAELADIDETVEFMAEHDGNTPEMSPQDEKKLNLKIMTRILGLTTLINTIMYMDKATLSYLAILGLWDATGLTQNKYNNVNTLFYVGFAIGQIPGTFVVQRFRLLRVLFTITALWLVLVFLVCVAKSYAGLVCLRFFLGFLEALAVPLLTTTNGMFMTASQRSQTQPLFWISCIASPIPTGFIAYGVLYAHGTLKPYQIMHLVIGGLTLLVAVLVLWFYPDNPARCRFLSTEEKVWTIRRVQQTQHNTIEQKRFKKHHAAEALKDPISWLFCGFMLSEQLANNLIYQQTLLFQNMGGVSALTNTLVTVAGAAWASVWALIAWLWLHFFPNTSCFTTIWSVLPCWAGSVAAVSLDVNNSIGMLAAISVAGQLQSVAWITGYGLAASTAGSSYLKRMTRNAMMMVAYSVSNLILPQLWQQRDAPRYVPAWIVQIVLSFTAAPAMVGVVWAVLAKRNKHRVVLDRKAVVDVDGVPTEVDVAVLDLTDLEDMSFVYPL